MNKYDLNIHQNPDAMAWTKFFRETHPSCNIDDDVMLGWFANAMMAMHDFLIYKDAPLNGDHAEFMLTQENVLSRIKRIEE